MPLAIETVLELLTAQRALHQITVGDADGAGNALRAALIHLDGAVSIIAGSFVTEMLERNHGQVPHLLETTVAALLDPPVSVDDPDREEKLYRRWLMGQDVVSDGVVRRRFEQRLRSRNRQKI